MGMKEQAMGYKLSFVVSLILAVLAIVTLIPDASAGKDCLLGYRAHCSFAPVSTLILAGLAAVNCSYRKRRLKVPE